MQQHVPNNRLQVTSTLPPLVQGGQPLGGGPQLSVNGIMRGFDETLAAHPKTWQNEDETYTTIVRYEPQDHPETEVRDPFSKNPTQERPMTPTNVVPPHRKPIAASTQSLYDDRENSGALQMVAVDLFKSYRKGKLIVPVLKGVNLGVREGEMLAIVGQSGSGKSTLLHLLGTLDSPDSGSIHFDGQRIDSLSGGQRDLLRNQFIGMIFQFYHLIPEMTTLENVLSPIMIRESVWGYMSQRKQYRRKATELLERVGLGHRLRHKPNELSGGEMQRAAIARALISDPQILLADEPTGNLDLNSAKEVLKLLCDLNREKKVTILMVTHDPGIAQESDRTVRLVDGRVVR
ncbi:MAG: ABC transporter ATP-binding protein [Planctomycetaceae bacterium]|nr:ABC transporter ATP-binding protein [Planctomycetaceae bacterium]